MYSGSKTLTVSTDAKFQSVEDVANMLLPLPTGGTVRLGEVAQVALETADADTVAGWMAETACCCRYPSNPEPTKKRRRMRWRHAWKSWPRRTPAPLQLPVSGFGIH